MDKLTDAQKQKYIEEGGTACPYCGSENIEGYHIEIGDGSATQDVRCLDCNKEWWDIYKLVGIGYYGEGKED